MGKSRWRKTACTVVVLCAATAITSPAQTFTTLLNFNGTNGSTSRTVLVQGSDGSFYGTTSAGGTEGYGTVFKFAVMGTLTTLHTFRGADGAFPSSLIQATDGDFYGSTDQGGANGVGTIFKITPAGKLTTLHSFNRTDGESPDSGLVQVIGDN